MYLPPHPDARSGFRGQRSESPRCNFQISIALLAAQHAPAIHGPSKKAGHRIPDAEHGQRRADGGHHQDKDRAPHLQAQAVGETVLVCLGGGGGGGGGESNMSIL